MLGSAGPVSIMWELLLPAGIGDEKGGFQEKHSKISV